MNQNKIHFDKKIWFFIIGTSILIPVYHNIRGLVLEEKHPYFMVISGVVFTFIVTFSITFANLKLIKIFLLNKLPWTNDTRQITKRIIIELILTSSIAALIMSIILLAFHFLFAEIPETFVKKMYFDNIVLALVINLIAMSIIEGNYIFNQWKESILYTEKLNRENIESQFMALKNQVNPHFLFNSMNVLSSLISKSPEKARQFVNEFSKVFRYVLDSGDELTTGIKQELEFLDSYCFLQKIRYGNNLDITRNISAEKLQYYLPVLTLQILVENAIKHNEISDIKPLHIEIYNEGDMLIVKNNLQIREPDSPSTGIGLTNLKERYGYFTDTEPVFKIEGNSYIAIVPLLMEE